jgi:hypothetical protein
MHSFFCFLWSFVQEKLRQKDRNQRPPPPPLWMQDLTHPDFLPVHCQTLQPSPYLDPSIYSYDARNLPRDGRARTPASRPFKFVCRSRPELLRFRLAPEDVAPPDDDGVAREVAFLAHPVLPLMLAVNEDPETGVAESVTAFARVD